MHSNRMLKWFEIHSSITLEEMGKEDNSKDKVLLSETHMTNTITTQLPNSILDKAKELFNNNS